MYKSERLGGEIFTYEEEYLRKSTLGNLTTGTKMFFSMIVQSYLYGDSQPPKVIFDKWL
jgi:hypothetical protein